MKLAKQWFCFALGSLSISQEAWSALQTTPFLAVHTQPQYAQSSSMPYANPQAPKGGVLTRASNGTFDNLNAMNGKGSSADGVEYLFDTLFESSLDEPGVMYPLLAQKLSYDPHQTHFVIFHLNPKAKFSDGSSLTAKDVKFSFDRYTTQGNPGLQMYLSDLDKTEVISTHQVKMTFKSKHNPEMPKILAQMPIYAEKDWKNKDFSRISLQPILGSGPYVLEKIDAGRSISFKRNPHYWAKDLPINQGRYNFDRVKFVYYRNLDVTFEGFKAGEYTFHQENLSKNWMTEYHFTAFKQGKVVKYAYQHHNPIPTQSFVFNLRRSPLQDIAFRKALTFAYDFEWQNKALFYGQYQRLQSYFANSELEAKGALSPAEQAWLKPHYAKLNRIQRADVQLNWKYPVSDATGFNRSNLLQARQLLLNAGYKYKNGQLVDRHGQAIVLEFLIHQDGLQRTLMPFVRNLKRLGIQMHIRQVDVPQYLERMRIYDFDMTTNVLPQSLTPGNEQAQFWGSAAADQLGNYNYPGIKNPVIDAAIQGIQTAKNRQQLVFNAKILDRLLRAGYYEIPTYGKGQTWYAYWNMYERPKRAPKLDVGVDYWWSNAQKASQIHQYLRQQK